MTELEITIRIPYEGAEPDEDQKRRIGQRLVEPAADIIEEEVSGITVSRDGLIVTVP